MWVSISAMPNVTRHINLDHVVKVEQGSMQVLVWLSGISDPQQFTAEQAAPLLHAIAKAGL